MSANRPGLNGRRVLPVRCLDRRGFADYDDGGRPVVFRWSCKNPKCCPEVRCERGEVKVHRMTLFGVQNGKATGEMTTACEPTRSFADLIQLLPPENVRRVEAG